MTTAHASVAAWVGDRVITAVEIDERLAALRSGPYAARLPHPDTAEGRNLRRWLVQAVTNEAVVDLEVARHAVKVDAQDASTGELTLGGALGVGGVAAALLATNAAARALRRHVTPMLPVPDSESRDYHARNRDRHPEPYPQVRHRIAAELAAADRDRRFARWLEGRHVALVRLAAGFEHPGDPRHPDAVHRH